MRRFTRLVIVALFLLGLSTSVSPIATAASKGKPKPTPTPTTTPTPTLAPTPTPTPTPTPATDIGVVVSAPTHVSTGSAIEYTITTTNYGPVTAQNVEFCSNLSIGNGFALVGLDQGTWANYVIGGLCSVWGYVPTLSVGASATMSYTITDGTGVSVITNTVNTTSSGADPVPANNSQTVTTTVGP